MFGRDIKGLLAIDNICILMKYLYMSKDNSVEVVNKFGRVNQIKLNESMEFEVLDLTLHNENPEIPAHKEAISLEILISIIDYLHRIDAKYFPDYFTSRWNEIERMVQDTELLNIKTLSKMQE